MFKGLDTTAEKGCQSVDNPTLVISLHDNDDEQKNFKKGQLTLDLKSKINSADFETAIELAGYGKFHYILLAICGLVSTSEEMDVSFICQNSYIV